MKEFSFLRALCGVTLLIFSAASAAEVCFENLDEIVLEDPNTQVQVPYQVDQSDMPCTADDLGTKQLVIPFNLQGLALNIDSVLVGATDATDSGAPVPVGLGGPVSMDVTVTSFPVPVANVTVTADPGTPGNATDDVNCGTTDVNTAADAIDDAVFACNFGAVNAPILPGTISAAGSGLARNQSIYIQPDALVVTPPSQTVVSAIGDPDVFIPVNVASVNGTSIPGVNVSDSRGGSCTPTNQTVTGTPTAFSCNVEELPSATPVNGTFTASDGVTNALDGTAGYTLEPEGLIITNVSPSAQVVNIGDTGAATVSVSSNGPNISNVNVTDSRGGSCTPVNATVGSGGQDFACTLAALPGGSSVNGTLTASASGATSDNDGYTLNPTLLTVAISSIPSCIDPGLLEFDITVTHNNTDTDVTSVPVTVSGTPAGECDTTLPNVPSTGSSYSCSFTPASLPVSGSASTSSAEANDGSDSYNVTQCQGQLPDYCNLPEHNIVQAASFINGTVGSTPFWNNGAFWNSGASAQDVTVLATKALALPFQPPGPGGNGGTINFTEQSQVFWNVSISDCPGDFSKNRPFVNDAAIGTTQAGTNWCFGGGGAGGTWNLSWGMSSGDAPDGSSCILLQPGFTYYLNIVAATNPAGTWVQQCFSGSCTVTIEP